MPEDGAVCDGVVHHLLFPCPVTDKILVCLCLFLSPFFSPYRVPVAVNSLYLGHMNTFGSGNIGKHRVFGDKVADHDKTATANVERTEQSLLHPIGQILYTLFIPAYLVIVQVVDDNIIRASLAVTETTGRLSTANSKELGTALGLEFSLKPRTEVFLLAEVGNQFLVEFKFGL